MQPADQEVFLSTGDLAARYQVPIATVHQWLHKGTAPTSIKIGRYRRFRLADVLDFERSRTNGPIAAKAEASA